MKQEQEFVCFFPPHLQLSESVHELAAVVLQVRLHVSLLALLVRTEVLVAHSLFSLIGHCSHLRHTEGENVKLETSAALESCEYNRVFVSDLDQTVRSPHRRVITSDSPAAVALDVQ